MWLPRVAAIIGMHSPGTPPTLFFWPCDSISGKIPFCQGDWSGSQDAAMVCQKVDRWR